ncbi:MAG TPA: hypothetical protein VGQ03_07865 [Nitrososphaera sp.]|nr:hypothetical protein [Nitrososphaera sp.]
MVVDRSELSETIKIGVHPRTRSLFYLAQKNTQSMSKAQQVPESKKIAARNLYFSDLPEDIIAMQLDLEIPVVIEILLEMNVYNSSDNQFSGVASA